MIKKTQEEIRNEVEISKTESEKKCKSLLIENSKFKANENVSTQLALQKKNLEIIIIDLEKSMAEKEAKILELEKRNANFGVKVSEMELASAAHQIELGKMVD